MQKKVLRKWNNIIHRDLGYFFVGMCIIYGISGIALNHMNDWNPSYSVSTKEINYSLREEKPSKVAIKNWLKKEGVNESYKKHYYPKKGEIKVFLKGGSAYINVGKQTAFVEILKRRPIFYEANLLHYNPGELWKWFSDLFSLSLILLAISGMFVLRGKNSLLRRGKWLVIAGVIIPLLLLINYL